ncbi:MAG: DUF4197 domain-containing protein [Bacteroidia bacterium]|nr:DUF4197 domain-containing protein [Bacteroidia bacterium]
MKKFIQILSLSLIITACTPQELQNVLGTIAGNGMLTEQEIGLGLKEALTIGIGKGSDQLSQINGYFDSPYKILLPEEARKVTDKLKVIPGFSDIEAKLVERLNRAAEEAAKGAKNIFVGAIKQITFQDALSILMGEKNAATNYLERTTYRALYDEFQPVILNALEEVQAAQLWREVVTKYNTLPLVQKVNPSLDDHVTGKALVGLFSMVEKKELEIRTNISERTTPLLRKVFAKQDNDQN